MLEALERRTKQFRSREELWPLRVPGEPVRLDDVIEEALGHDARVFDTRTLRSRTLLHFSWDDGGSWDAWVIALPSKAKLYCDSDDEETRVLASGGSREKTERRRGSCPQWRKPFPVPRCSSSPRMPAQEAHRRAQSKVERTRSCAKV